MPSCRRVRAGHERNLLRLGAVLTVIAHPGPFFPPGTVRDVIELTAGPLRRFADWPDEQVPRRTAGVYTVWRDEEFLYVGMSGRGAQSEDFTSQPGAPDGNKGLWTRLNSHASGRKAIRRSIQHLYL